MLGDHPPQALEDFCDSLMEFGLTGIAVQDVRKNEFEFFVNRGHSWFLSSGLGGAWILPADESGPRGRDKRNKDAEAAFDVFIGR
jgi:hypothetical protein